MRAFVRLRELLASHAELSRKLDELEKKYDKQFAIVFQAIRQLMQPPEKPKRHIACLPNRQGRQGFRVGEPKAQYRTKREKHR